jgi:hypothetical protein
MTKELTTARRPEIVAGGDVCAIVPHTLDEVFRVAKAVCIAKLAPDAYTTERGRQLPDEEVASRVVVGIMKGAEVGLAPITALGNIAIINGRPCVWGDAAVALVQRTGLVERVEARYEGDERAVGDATAAAFPDDFTAVFRIWRRGQSEPYEGRFSVRDARRARLWMNVKRAPWIEYPKRMLLSRARAYALRDGFADALCGLSIREEIDDLPPAPQAATDLDFLADAAVTGTEHAALPAPVEAPLTIDASEPELQLNPAHLAALDAMRN